MEPNENDSEPEPNFDRVMYMEILRDEPPLRRYVSRGDTPDQVDIPGPHLAADRAIFRAIRFTMQDGTPRLQPVLGSAGMGKTHLYWVIKEQEEIFSKGKFTVVYVPSPPAPVRIPLHFHACIVDEMGEDLFEQTVDYLITKFGGLKGVTHEIYDYTYALERLLVDYPGISSDVVKVLLRYRLDPPTRDLAKRWLLGDALNDDETAKLEVRTVLEDDDVVLATLKLLAEGSERPMVLFIDEMEGPYNSHGEESERYFLEVLKRIYNECKNIVIIASCLKEIWDRIYEIADAPMKSRMEPPVSLRHFTKEDIESFVKETMSRYWKAQNIEAPPDPLFPFTGADIEEAFKHSSGVPREAIRFLIPQLDSILFDTPTKEVAAQADYVIKLTPTVVLGSIVSALSMEAGKMNIEVNLLMASGGTQKQSAAIIVLKKDDMSFNIGIDVPNVKDWNRSGGVAAYYSAKRLKKAIDSEEVAFSVIAVPENTKGTKFEAIKKDMIDKMAVLRLNEKSATSLVEATNNDTVPEDQKEFFRDILERVTSRIS